jgi:hypothetical protein
VSNSVIIGQGGSKSGGSIPNPLPIIGTLTDNNAAPSTNNIGALVATATFNRPGKTNGDLTTLSVDLDGGLRTHQRSENVLGDIVAVGRYNQIAINFSQTFDSDYITNSVTGSGTVAPTQSDGQAVYTVTEGSQDCNGTSAQTIQYHPGHEWYAEFTASFTAGAANSTQRIGPYNATDGFWVGWEGTTWGFTQYQNSSATQVARASFNGDKCTGEANSPFTSGGTPVALDLTKLNIFRIHGAWFGTAPVVLEVFAPDGVWVTMHTFRFPNTLTAPYAYTTDWSMQIDVANAANTSTISMTTACWAAGVTDDTVPISAPLDDEALAVLTKSVIAGRDFQGNYQNVGVDDSGRLETITTPTTPNVVQVGYAVSGGSVSTLTYTFPLPVTYGNVLVVFAVASSDAALPTIADSLSGVWNNLDSQPGGAGLAAYVVAVSTIQSTGVVPALPDTITVTPGASGAVALIAYEIQGILTQGVLTDWINSSQGTGESTVLDEYVSPIQSNDLVLCFFAGTAGQNLSHFALGPSGNMAAATPYPYIIDVKNEAVLGNSALTLVSSIHTLNTTANLFLSQLSVAASGAVSGSMIAFKAQAAVQIAANPSVSLVNNPSPLYATEIGILDAFGNLQPIKIGTRSMPTLDGADMSGTTPGTAPSYTLIAGGIYNSSAPSPTNGQTLPLQLDSAGNLKTVVDSGAITATLNAETTKVIGTVNQGTSPWIIAGGGTAGSSGTAVLTVQGIASGTALPVSIASLPSGAVTNAGTFAVQATLAAETTKVIGTVNVAASQTIAVTNTGTFAVQTTLPAMSSAVSQALTTSVNIKSSAGTVYGFDYFNPNAVPVYVFLYNTTTTPGTIGATTVLLFQKGLPAGAGSNVSFPNGLAFSTGIAIAVSTSPTSSAAPSTGLVLTTLYV